MYEIRTNPYGFVQIYTGFYMTVQLYASPRLWEVLIAIVTRQNCDGQYFREVVRVPTTSNLTSENEVRGSLASLRFLELATRQNIVVQPIWNLQNTFERNLFPIVGT